MVFKRPTNSRDDRNGKSSNRNTKGDDNSKRPSSSNRGSFSKSTDKSSNNDSKKRYSSGPAAERSSFSSPGEKKSYGPRKPYSGRPTGDGDAPKRDRSEGKSFEPRKKPYSGRSADSNDDRPKRNFGGEGKSFNSDRKPYGSRSTGSSEDRPKRNFSGDRSEGRGAESDRKPYGSRSTGGSEDRPKRNFSDERAPKRFETSYEKKPERAGGSTDKPKRAGFESRGGKKFDNGSKPGGFKRDGDKPFRKPRPEGEDFDAPVRTMRSKKASEPKESGLIRLNRYIANAGICSRRKADELIEAGVVSVNGEVISELGFKVDPFKDEIRYNGEMLKREKMVYVLLNKPKDYITTTDDPQERRTVMHLVEKASRERIYPIGRLDRNTTGLLLMTNDGDLADKLSHPRSNISKLYHVELSKSVSQGDLNKIGFGVELEDGVIKPDSVSYVAGGSKREIGIQIHSGKNRIVRRIFESLGYEVVKLDRVVYANLTKKDLPRGRWRFLDEKEIIQLKHLIK
ncbi:pseudouridine synthase [Mucilaginibacter calamicampi]|uniref:Pseudouridine synthase n=1 Tax=Mucilaginibacter calamicampi TaxID=1302352 RepID=A0ABW2YX24_9SPHI